MMKPQEALWSLMSHDKNLVSDMRQEREPFMQENDMTACHLLSHQLSRLNIILSLL